MKKIIRLFLVLSILTWTLVPNLATAMDMFDYGDTEIGLFGELSPNFSGISGLESGLGGGLSVLHIPRNLFGTNRVGIRFSASYIDYGSYGNQNVPFYAMPILAGLQYGLFHFESDYHDFVYLLGDAGVSVGTQTTPAFDLGVGVEMDHLYLEWRAMYLLEGIPHAGAAGPSPLMDFPVIVGFWF
jgi:hypothetical protein